MTIRTALMDYPEWRAADERLTELKHELMEIEMLYNNGLSTIQMEMAKRDSERLNQEAMDYLDGSTPSEPSKPRASLEVLARRKKVVLRSIELQKERMLALKAVLSAEICKALRPAYRNIIREVAQKAVALAEATEKERVFREQLIDGDISFTGHLPPALLRGMGKLNNDPYGRINQFFSEAIHGGYLTQDEKEVIAK